MSKAGFDADHARAIIAQMAHLKGALLPMLHALQDAFGYVDDACVPMLAERLNLSLAEVRGVISFYHDFRSSASGQHVLKICRAESCQSMGAERLVKHLAQEHRLVPGQTSPDAALSVENVYCLGHCALSPAAMLDGEPVARLTEARLDALVLAAKGAR